MLFGFTYLQIAVAAGIFVVSTVVTTAIVGAFLVMIPADHFVGERRQERNPLLRVGKNLLGVVLIAVGIVLSFPGVPGQGLLTILVGILLLDIPAKRRLELAIVQRDAIRRAIDKLRGRFQKPPILTEPDATQHPEIADS